MSDPAKPKRTCGSCTLCCKALAVFELNKPTGDWCPHCATGSGCRVYENRPLECSRFDCLWLQGTLLEQDRPDRLHAVLYHQPGTDVAGRKIIAVSESYPGASDRNQRLAGILRDVLRKGFSLVVCNADYIEYRRPGAPPERRPVNKGYKLRVLAVGEDPAAYELRMRQTLEQLAAKPEDLAQPAPAPATPPTPQDTP